MVARCVSARTGASAGQGCGKGREPKRSDTQHHRLAGAPTSLQVRTTAVSQRSRPLGSDAVSWPSEATPPCHGLACVVKARPALPIGFYLNVLEANRVLHAHALL